MIRNFNTTGASNSINNQLESLRRPLHLLHSHSRYLKVKYCRMLAEPVLTAGLECGRDEVSKLHTIHYHEFLCFRSTFTGDFQIHVHPRTCDRRPRAGHSHPCWRRNDCGTQSITWVIFGFLFLNVGNVTRT